MRTVKALAYYPSAWTPCCDARRSRPSIVAGGVNFTTPEIKPSSANQMYVFALPWTPEGGRMPRLAGISIGLLLLMSVNAGSQTVVSSFDELRGVLKPGRTVTVIDEGGQVTRGKVATISQDALVLDTEGASGRELRTFGKGPVKAFVERDSLWNGFGWGALAGLGAAAIATAACTGCDAGLVFAFAAAGTIPGGAAAGVIMDMVHRPDVRIEYGKAERASSITIGPWLGAQTRGVYLAARW